MPRTIDSEPALYDAAVKILSRRAHSVSEMKKALIRRTADEELIQKVIARLKQNGLIDDARYAKQFARQRTDRKLKFFRGEIGDKKIASLYRTLLRAGFSSDTIRRELKRATSEDLPEVESPDETSGGGF